MRQQAWPIWYTVSLSDLAEDRFAVTLSVIAPVRNDGTEFRKHFRACLAAISGLDVEIVILDNQSVDGCCHGLPRNVLIVRTERVESQTKLWRLGLSLASGLSVLWIPQLLLHPPDKFRVLVLQSATLESEEGEQRPTGRLVG